MKKCHSLPWIQHQISNITCVAYTNLYMLNQNFRFRVMPQYIYFHRQYGECYMCPDWLRYVSKQIGPYHAGKPYCLCYWRSTFHILTTNPKWLALYNGLCVSMFGQWRWSWTCKGDHRTANLQDRAMRAICL